MSERRDWKDVKLGDVDEVVRLFLQDALSEEEAVHVVTILSTALADVVMEASENTRKVWLAITLAGVAETIRGVPKLVEKAIRGGFVRDPR